MLLPYLLVVMNLVLVLVQTSSLNRCCLSDGVVGSAGYHTLFYWHTNTLAKLIKGINHDYWVGGQAAKGMVSVIQQRLALMHIGRTYDDEDSTGMGSIHRRPSCELHMQ